MLSLITGLEPLGTGALQPLGKSKTIAYGVVPSESTEYGVLPFESPNTGGAIGVTGRASAG